MPKNIYKNFILSIKKLIILHKINKKLKKLLHFQIHGIIIAISKDEDVMADCRGVLFCIYTKMRISPAHAKASLHTGLNRLA